MGRNLSKEQASIFVERKEYLQQKIRYNITLSSPDIGLFRNSRIMSDL